MTLMDSYYLVNKVWVYVNGIMILPFIISCVCRYRQPDFKKKLWTDHLARFFLVFTVIFYLFDMYYKYQVDGADSICEKSFYLHHISSFIIIIPLFMNSYIGWWECPIGFMHGLCILFPQVDLISYIYIGFMFLFHYMIYQEPYCNLKGYGLTRFFVNFVYIFGLMLLLGDCSNYLPFGPAN